MIPELCAICCPWFPDPKDMECIMPFKWLLKEVGIAAFVVKARPVSSTAAAWLL
jgi:hypothetical protein